MIEVLPLKDFESPGIRTEVINGQQVTSIDDFNGYKSMPHNQFSTNIPNRHFKVAIYDNQVEVRFRPDTIADLPSGLFYIRTTDRGAYASTFSFARFVAGTPQTLAGYGVRTTGITNDAFAVVQLETKPYPLGETETTSIHPNISSDYKRIIARDAQPSLHSPLNKEVTENGYHQPVFVDANGQQLSFLCDATTTKKYIEANGIKTYLADKQDGNTDGSHTSVEVFGAAGLCMMHVLDPNAIPFVYKHDGAVADHIIGEIDEAKRGKNTTLEVLSVVATAEEVETAKKQISEGNVADLAANIKPYAAALAHWREVSTAQRSAYILYPKVPFSRSNIEQIVSTTLKHLPGHLGLDIGAITPKIEKILTGYANGPIGR